MLKIDNPTLKTGDIVRMSATFQVDRDRGLQVGDLGVVRTVLDKTGNCCVTWFNGRGHGVAMTSNQLEKVNDPD